MNEQAVAIITGAASGIGREVANSLIKRGYRVLATDINEAGLRDYARAQNWPEGRVLLRKQDVRDRAAWKEIVDLVVKTWGQLDIMLNIAGYLQSGYFQQVEPEEIERHLDINVKGVIYGTQAAAEFMLRQRYGHIINIASIAGLIPVRGLSLYSASKFAVRGFSLTVGQELRSYGIQVTTVCPDVVRTPMVTSQTERPEAAMLFLNPKMLTAEQVAQIITGKVLKDKPVEIFIPWSSGLFAKLATIAPGLAGPVEATLAKWGRSVQKRFSRGPA